MSLRQRLPQFTTARALAVLAAVPVVYMLARAVLASRNVAYWDEVDTAIALLLKLVDGSSWSDALRQIFAITNEHRTATSRFLFVASYWLTGTVNFSVIGVIGNLFLCGLCALLIAKTETTERRVRMAVLLAALLFQLEHYENFLWSGASIDHFQVVLLSGGALVALTGTSASALGGAALLGVLATYTLAHGIAVWPVGAAVLALERRWRHLAVWLAVAAGTGLVFFQNFSFNSAHRVGDFSLTGVGTIVHYWLTLLGAPLALGELAVAPFLGIALIALFGWRISRATPGRSRWALPLVAWAVAALFLVAIGRAELTGGVVYSRYYVLGALAWALLLFLQFDDWHDPARPYRVTLRALPLLALFNLSANAHFASDARSWIISRDSATHFYMEYGRDGMGRHTLHPIPEHATLLLRQAEETGVYQMPRLCRQRWFPDARPVAAMTYFFDRINLADNMVVIDGWAAFPGLTAKPGQIHLVLRSAKSQLFFTTLPVPRDDVAGIYPAEQWRDAGFRFQRRRWLLPKEDFQIGVLIKSERGEEMIMTAHRLDLTGEGRGILANGE